MEQIKIAITHEDDTITIMSFIADDGNGYRKFPSDENIEAEIKRSFNFKSWRRIEESEIIKDRDFRNAWRDSGTELHVHMPTAREIHRNRIRFIRSEKLAALDSDYMKADEQGNIEWKKDISHKKQKLRDITKHPGIEAATNPEELKKIWFDE